MKKKYYFYLPNPESIRGSGFNLRATSTYFGPRPREVLPGARVLPPVAASVLSVTRWQKIKSNQTNFFIT